MKLCHYPASCRRLAPIAVFRPLLFCRFALLLSCLFGVPAHAQEPGQNVNMVSGTVWPYGDPFLERQDEPSIGVSTRNPLHLLAGANDYRTVDLNLPEVEPGDPLLNTPTGEPWVGEYMSIDGGAHWQSTLLPGYPQDTSVRGLSSPLHGFTTAADPVIASGTNGMLYYGGIAFDRGSNLGLVFVSRFIDLNNKENGNIAEDSYPIRYINTVPVSHGTNSPAQFLDKPWIATDIPRGSSTCSFSVTQADGTVVEQTIPAGNVYLAYADVATSSTGVQTSTIYFSRSTNCGTSWSSPIAISKGYAISQGVTIQIDPESGIVYVAWRVIHNTPTSNDGIAITASLNGGQSFLPAITLVSLPPFNANEPTAHAFFDQNTTETSFRTTAYPALAVADSGIPLIPGPLYLAWSQRGEGPNGEARIMMLAIPGNASFIPGGFQPPTPFPIDNGAVTNDLGGTFPALTVGHQVMPIMTFNQGKLMVLYYDLRQDHSIGEFTPNILDGLFTPDSNGNFFEESRYQIEDFPTTAYSPYFIDDSGLTVRRHTIDLVLAQSNGGSGVPKFDYVRISHYDFGLFEGEATGETAPFHQLKFDPPNLPMFEEGEGAFMGDYIGITGQPFVLVKCGSSQCWTYNNPSPPGVAGTIFAAPKPAPSSTVHFASWTSNQDVIPPANGHWDTYTAIASGQSVYNPGTTVPSCQPGNEGDRNQNVYESRISQGLLVSSPQVSKPLSSTIERGFVVLVQNQTSGRSTPAGLVNYFRLTIANQPVNGFASFAQFVPPSPLPRPPFPATNNGIIFPLTSVDVAIAPHTGVARTIFAVSSSATANILVNVNEITGLGGTVFSGGMSAFILLNADGTVPANLVDPNGETGSNSITDVELYNPNVSAPNVSAPNVSAPNVSAPNVSAQNVSAPNVSAPNVSAPNVSAPNVSAYGVANPNVSAPNVSAPNVSAAPPSDGTYTVSNTGNTTASYNLALTGSTAYPLQLLLSQLYMTPQTDGNCNLITQQQNITLANVPNVPLTPVNQLPNPNVSAAPVTEPTFSLAPGDTAYITIRGNVDIATMQQIVNQVSPVIVPQAVNSNSTSTTPPPIYAPLTIVTTLLPPTDRNDPGYSLQLLAAGGKTGTYTWSITSGALPPGINLSPSGLVSGQATTPGSFPVTIRVADTNSPQDSALQSYIFNVSVTPLTVQFVMPPPDGVVGQSYVATPLSVTGGTTSYGWTATGLPAGLSLNPSTGQITGIPTTANPAGSTVVVTATDSATPAESQSYTTTIPIGAVIQISPPTLPSGTIGVPYSAQLTAGGGIGTLVFGSPALPSGGTLQSNGLIAFTNPQVASVSFTVSVHDQANPTQTVSANYTIQFAVPPAPTCSPVPRPPLGWYPFNGNTLDIRGGRPGTLQGAYTFVPAEVGQGYKPGIAGSVITVQNGQFLEPVNLTVGAWIRVDHIDAVPFMPIVWQGDLSGDTSSTQYALAVEGTSAFVSSNPNPTVFGTPGAGKIVVIITNGSTEIDVFSNTVLTAGVFNYVAFSDAASVNLWVNGVLDTQTTSALPVSSSTVYPFQIGGILNGSAIFDGVINQLQIWGTPLTTAQVAGIYAAGAAGECQNLWFTEAGVNKVGMISPSSPNASSDFSTPTSPSTPYGIVAGPDGNVWFTEHTPNNIGVLTFLGGGSGIGEYPIAYPPAFGTSSQYGAYGITSGPDGNLWFTEANSPEDTSFVGYISTSGTIQTFSIGTDLVPQGITPGPDGNVWFTEYGIGTNPVGNIGKISPSAPTSVGTYPTPTVNSGPESITIGPDGNLWFTEFLANQIGVITTGGNVVHEYPIPTPNGAPFGITVGPDGNVWFTESNGNKIGRITTGGVVTEFPIPTSGSYPQGITNGPDGNLWFVESTGGNIGRITPSGVVTEFPAPTPSSVVWGITLGP